MIAAVFAMSAAAVRLGVEIRTSFPVRDLIVESGRVAGVVVLVDRSGGKVRFGRIPMFSLVRMTPETWTAAECPMCRAGGRPVHPGS